MTPVHRLIINMVNHCYNSAAKKKKTFVQYYQLLPKLSKCCFLLYKPISPSIQFWISNIWIIKKFQIHNLKELEFKIPYEFKIYIHKLYTKIKFLSGSHMNPNKNSQN